MEQQIGEVAAGGDVDLSGYYTSSQVDSLLSGKANTNHVHTISDISNLQNILDGKASLSHTHSQYLTENDVNTIILQKLSNYYTKAEIDELIDASVPTYRWNKYYPYKVTIVRSTTFGLYDPDEDEDNDGWMSDAPFPVNVSSATYVRYNTSAGGTFHFENFGGSENVFGPAVVNKYIIQDRGSYDDSWMFYPTEFIPNSVSTVQFRGDTYHLDRTRQRGDFIEEVTSLDPAAYPNNDYDSNTGYWYVKIS